MDGFLKDGAALLALGGVGASLRELPQQLGTYLVSALSVSISLNTGDPLFSSYYNWIAGREFLIRPSEYKLYKIKDDIVTVPNFSFNLFWYNNHLVSCSISSSRNRVDDSYINERSITLRVFGGSFDTLQKIKNELESREDRGIQIYCKYGKGGYDRYTENYRTRRSIDTIYLPTHFKEEIVKDLTDFYLSREWYAKHSILWKRGYLLYGEAGGGKSSLIIALASLFNKKIVRVDCTRVDNETFGQIYSEMEDNSFLVLEDFDCSKASNRTVEGETITALTFDCLLNYLDGPESIEGVVVFITTNHIEKLDPALIRAGRIDRKYQMPLATQDQKKEMFLSFYPNSLFADEFTSLVHTSPMASLQELFISYKEMNDADFINKLKAS